MPGRLASPSSVLWIDIQRRIDVNNLNVFVTNFGSWAYDLSTGNSGLIYPKGTDKTAIFDAGIWFGAKVNGRSAPWWPSTRRSTAPGVILRDGQ